jgi:hypothetical protein
MMPATKLRVRDDNGSAARQKSMPEPLVVSEVLVD